MNCDLNQTLAEVAENTFASMAFVFPADDDDGNREGRGSTACVRLSFAGPLVGSLILSVDEGMLPILAANMLGLEHTHSASAEQQQDALKELLNVICGNLLPLVTTPKDVFHVHEPCYMDGREADGQIDSTPPAATATLQLECGQADLMFFIGHPNAVPAM